jgi:hypothetical protein
VAETVTGWPTTAALGELVTMVVVESELTVCISTAEVLPAFAVSPEYATDKDAVADRQG